MTHPAYLRDKARLLRVERRLSVDEIALRLALPKTTVYGWVRDIALQRPRRANPGQLRGNAAMRANYRARREAAYSQGRAEFDALATADPSFRDFVNLYLAEGCKRQRGTVSICNSDPAVVLLSDRWIREFTANRVGYSLQYHADQHPDELCEFWRSTLGRPGQPIRLQRKSNSGQLASRTWRSVHGVLAVTTHDTLLHARLQGWMAELREQWPKLDALGA